MTAIAPNSTIKLGQSALQYGSEDTFYWSSKSDQMENIFAEVVATFPRCTYQRDRRGYVRVEGNAEVFDYCNYMAFQNTNYVADPSKWFYCFVLDIEYINNEVMEIHYEIDYIQTYYFDFSINSCFVERCHTYTDEIGDNILPETIDCGEYIGNDQPLDLLSLAPRDSNWYVVIQLYKYGGDIKNQIVDGILQGCWLFAYPCTSQGLQDLDTFFASQTSANVIDLYIVHGSVVKGKFISGDSGQLSPDTYGLRQDFAIPQPSASTLLDGYKPKNKKLYTYPYCFADIDNGSGDSLELRYEFFTNDQAGVSITGTISDPAEVVVYPRGYKGTLTTQKYLKESLKLPGLPHCTWSYDTFKEWLATQGVATALAVVTGAFSSQVVPATVGLFSRITNRTKAGTFDMRHNTYEPTTPTLPSASHVAVGALVAQGYTASLKNGTSRGGGGSTSPVASNSYGVWYTRMSVTSQYAKMIDDYFTMYGYAYNKIMPIGESKRYRRSRFTYIKTVGVDITGQLPQDARNEIATLYDRGIRFWADHLNMYNYEYDNTVLS